MGREAAYYNSLRRAAAVLNSDAPLSRVLSSIVRGTGSALEARASLVLLDSTRTKLVHSASWKLPQSYLHKGVLDAEKSLAEVVAGKPVAITDVSNDPRIQYPALAVKARIASMLGVPVFLDGLPVGSLRVYTSEPHEFSAAEVSFVTAMANLAAAAMCAAGQHEKSMPTSTAAAPEAGMLREAREIAFAHPSEAEFASILDFYRIEWVYEPRSFPLAWEGERITEMFTPDFYLPGLDLYVELTTLKQHLVTEKNRKLRRLRELYPEIDITLLYKKDFERLLAKYGFGPLAKGVGRGVTRVLYSEAEIQRRVRELADQISRDYAGRQPVMVGVLRGVFCFMADLVRRISTPLEVEFMAISYFGGNSAAVHITKDLDLDLAERHVVMVEDIVDTGMTLGYMLSYLKTKGPASLAVCTLLDKRVRRIAPISLDYIGFEIPDEFVVGYGLDYREQYRNLPFIGILKPDEAPPGQGKDAGSEPILDTSTPR